VIHNRKRLFAIQIVRIGLAVSAGLLYGIGTNPRSAACNYDHPAKIGPAQIGPTEIGLAQIGPTIDFSDNQNRACEPVFDFVFHAIPQIL